MSAVVTVVIIAVIALLALALVGVLAIGLARLQAAVMKHRASEGTRDDDDALYAAAGFPTRWPDPPQSFMRGSGERIR
jgi:uncharacterized membrane protein